MDITKKINVMLAETGKKQTDLAKKIGTSQQNLNAKFKRNNFTVADMQLYADTLGYELIIEFRKKD
ncbi:helix-turn-helix domain-containing protein [Clostridium hydrogeniformans]|uniref:helix-turn-helix domain-containing protein n=1 Tax=Clostridium hydrogeniformans TaxID=349933 RepID=UPI000481136B|nr:helix-turn-helix domain-containing protein [Clostridium hydrogeniformans]